VAHPEIVEELFNALYESQTASFDKKAEAWSRYDAILQKLMMELDLSRGTLLRGLGPRYGEWMRRNKLPQPPKE